MNTYISKEILNDIYEDMKARIDMGLTDFTDADSFMENLWDAVAEKVPNKYVPDRKGEVDLFGVMFGTISERIIREHYNENGREWW